MTTLKARPTIYKGTQMRSRLEAGFAQWLDGFANPWAYEPHAFGGVGGQYLPDFRVDEVLLRDGTRGHVYVEVKPPIWRDDRAEEEQLRRRMSTIFESEPNAVVIVAQPGLTTDLEPLGWTALEPPAGARPALWLTLTQIGVDSTGRLTIIEPLLSFNGPWVGEWWKG